MIKIIEGTAAHIEEQAVKLEGYKLESLQFTHRSLIYTQATAGASIRSMLRCLFISTVLGLTYE